VASHCPVQAFNQQRLRFAVEMNLNNRPFNALRIGAVSSSYMPSALPGDALIEAMMRNKALFTVGCDDGLQK